jgi:hypothetical protein
MFSALYEILRETRCLKTKISVFQDVVDAPIDAGADAGSGVARDNAALIDGAALVVVAGEHAGARWQCTPPTPAHRLEKRAALGFYPAPNFLFVHACLQLREDCKRERDLSDFQRVKDSSERDSTSNIYSFIDENAHSNFTQSHTVWR